MSYGKENINMDLLEARISEINTKIESEFQYALGLALGRKPTEEDAKKCNRIFFQGADPWNFDFEYQGKPLLKVRNNLFDFRSPDFKVTIIRMI